MIQAFVDAFMQNKIKLRTEFMMNHPKAYSDIVTAVIKILPNTYGSPDPERITEIDHGSYQGDKLFIIAASRYQPDKYWYVNISYGSCSSCDTMEHIAMDGGMEQGLTEQQLDDYVTLALHIVQNIKKLP